MKDVELKDKIVDGSAPGMWQVIQALTKNSICLMVSLSFLDEVFFWVICTGSTSILNHLRELLTKTLWPPCAGLISSHELVFVNKLVCSAIGRFRENVDYTLIFFLCFKLLIEAFLSIYCRLQYYVYNNWIH
jgi:hypothetical protein